MNDVPETPAEPQLPGSVQIILSEGPRAEAYGASFDTIVQREHDNGAQHYEATEVAREALKDFKGPYFKQCVASVHVDTGFVTVHLTDGTTYTYPMHGVQRVKTFLEK